MYFKHYCEDIFARRPSLKAVEAIYHGDKDKRIYYALDRDDFKSIINIIQHFYQDLERLVLYNEYNHLKTVDSNIIVKVKKLDCSRLVQRKYTLCINVFCKPNNKYIAKGIYPFEFMIIYPKK